jgi:hypothetical protein
MRSTTIRTFKKEIDSMKKWVKAAILIGIVAGLTGCTLPRCSLQGEQASGVIASLFGA